MNRSLKTLYIYNGLFVLAHQALGPLFALFVEGIDSNVLAVSISWAIFLCSNIFFTFIIEKVGDRIKEKENLLLSGYFVRSFVWFLYIFVSNIYQLFALQVLLGVGAALGTPAFGAIFAEHLDCGRHMADYSRWKIIADFAGAIGVLIGGVIVKYFGFDVLFGIISVLALVCGLGVLFKPKELL